MALILNTISTPKRQIDDFATGVPPNQRVTFGPSTLLNAKKKQKNLWKHSILPWFLKVRHDACGAVRSALPGSARRAEACVKHILTVPRARRVVPIKTVTGPLATDRANGLSVS